MRGPITWVDNLDLLPKELGSSSDLKSGVSISQNHIEQIEEQARTSGSVNKSAFKANRLEQTPY